MDWQSYSALAIVAMTAGVFVIRLVRRRMTRKGGGCAVACGACHKPR